MAGQYESLAEIEKRYPNEWVLIDQPKTSNSQEVLGGFVLHHSADKVAVYERTKDLPRPFNIAVWYTGSFVQDGEECLLNFGLPE